MNFDKKCSLFTDWIVYILTKISLVNICKVFLFLGQADRDNLQKQIDTNAANGDKSSDELREMIRHAIIFVIV